MKLKKIPMRTCVISRVSYPKSELTRIVCDKDGKIFVDPSGKANGRGAYIKLSVENIESDKKKHLLQRSLKTDIPNTIYDDLMELCNE